MKLFRDIGLTLLLLVAVRADIYCQSPSKSSETKILEKSFRLTLPGKWSYGPVDDPNKRTYSTSSEQLTVSIFGTLLGDTAKMSHDDRVAAFKAWVDKRKALETRLPGYEKIALSQTLYAEQRAVLAGRYSGFDPAHKRRFRCLVLASAVAFEIFYYEILDSNDQTADDRAREIFNSVNIPE